MKKLKLVVSFPNENSYQLEQARTAKEKPLNWAPTSESFLPKTMLLLKASRFSK